MITISLCMIVKNEEGALARCLGCVQDIADEIIIVDTGSTDRTKEIAAGFTNNIYDFTWINDFAAARNYSFAKAKMEYILWLDADDLLLPEDALRLKNLKSTLSTAVDVVMMRYNTGFDPQGKVLFSYFRERLSKRSSHFQWREPVHEYLEIGGNIINSDICVTHAKAKDASGTPTARNLEIYESLLREGGVLSQRGRYYYARELKDNGRYGDAIKQFNLFLESGLGWVEDNITACGELAKCHLWRGEEEKAFAAMLQSFLYDTPRAELCCQIGYYFQNKKQFRQAAFWFEMALKLEKPQNSWGFLQHDCWGYIPSVECAVCYDNLGDYRKAEIFNELAAGFKPDSPAVLHNKKYFAERKSAQQRKYEEEEQVDVAADISNHQS